MKTEPDLPPHMQDYLKIVSQKADRLRHMLQDIFDVSKAATGNITLMPEYEGLALQHKAAVHQHPEGIPGRVAHGKHQRFTGEGPAGGKDAGQPSVLLLKTGEGRVEVHLAAQSFDLPADGGDNAMQF